MNCKEFIQEMEENISNSKDAFIANMELLKDKNLSYCEWISIFCAWMEWSDYEDCLRYYDG